MAYDVLTLGRISVDVYPNDIGVPLAEVNSFGKFLGGSATNVAVAAARHGRNAAVLTKVGDDDFGTFLERELDKFRVDRSLVSRDANLQTPVTFCAIQPPEDFPLYFYGRFPMAPDWNISTDDLDLRAIREAKIFWTTVTGLSREPSRSAQLAAHEARPIAGLAEDQHTILDLDYRPVFWDSVDQAREQVARVLPYATVAIGNDTECAVAVGEGTPDEQADRLLDAGVKIAVVKLGPEGVMAKTRTQRIVSAPVTVETANGLGAGDSFGGAFCHGLRAGWPLEQVLDYANAAGAIVASQIACSDAMPTPDEVIALLTERGRHVPTDQKDLV